MPSDDAATATAWGVFHRWPAAGSASAWAARLNVRRRPSNAALRPDATCAYSGAAPSSAADRLDGALPGPSPGRARWCANAVSQSSARSNATFEANGLGSTTRVRQTWRVIPAAAAGHLRCGVPTTTVSATILMDFDPASLCCGAPNARRHGPCLLRRVSPGGPSGSSRKVESR
jgi:hypothetical protein